MATVDDGQSTYINNQSSPLKDEHVRLVIRVLLDFLCLPHALSFKYSPLSLTCSPLKNGCKRKTILSLWVPVYFQGLLLLNFQLVPIESVQPKGGGVVVVDS